MSKIEAEKLEELSDELEEKDLQELLADAPEFLPVARWRQRFRSRFAILAARIASAANHDDDGDLEVLEALADFDEFCEKVARNSIAYEEWVVGAESEAKLLALLNFFGGQLEK